MTNAIDVAYPPSARDATAKPLQEAHVPPLAIYSDPAYFDAEVREIFHKTWNPLGIVSDLPEPGSYFTTRLIDEPILILRDAAGKVRAFSNVCRHRGTQLVEGCGAAASFRCPYHAWVYGLDGMLKSAPFMNQTEGFNRDTIGLTEFRVELWNGFIMVNLDQQASPMAPQIEPLTQYLEPYKLEGRQGHLLLEQRCDWNWKLSLENFTEAYHHIAVHAQSINPEAPAERVIYDDTNDAYSLFHIRSHDGKKRERARLFDAVPDLPVEYENEVGVFNVYPTLHVLVDPGVALWLIIDVHGPQDHTLRWRVLVPPDVSELPDFEERMAKYRAFMLIILGEDIEICRRVKSSSGTRQWSPGRYSYMEKSLQQMHRWLLERMKPAAA